MQNVEMKIEGQTLVIRVKLDADLGPSKSGKTILIASSNGNAPIPGTPAKIGLNVYKHKL